MIEYGDSGCLYTNFSGQLLDYGSMCSALQECYQPLHRYAAQPLDSSQWSCRARSSLKPSLQLRMIFKHIWPSEVGQLAGGR